jgi:hypothetical protein
MLNSRRMLPPGMLDKCRKFGYSHKVADELGRGCCVEKLIRTLYNIQAAIMRV